LPGFGDCAQRPPAVAALTDGRCAARFTPEAMGDARRADAPELSVYSACDTIRMSAIRKLAAPATDNGMLAPEPASGLARRCGEVAGHTERRIGGYL